MRRFLFPARFADGPSGAGLLVLRTASAVTGIGLVAGRFSERTPSVELAAGVLLVVSGVAVLTGMFSAASATLMAVCLTWFWLPLRAEAPLAGSPAALLTIADAVAIALLGPGAYSIDARLFGPREIVVSRDRGTTPHERTSP